MNDIIRLRSGDLEVEVWTLGARLNGVWFDGIGSLVDGAETEDEARGAKQYNGAVVGPVANRIAGARAQIDGRACQFEANERGRTALHSGSSGVHAQIWSVFDQTDTDLTLRLSLPAGLGGFPGNRSLSVSYRLRGPEMYVGFHASTDAPTWINLALHPYWRFGAAGRNGSRLQVAADRYLPVDEDQIPTGEAASVAGTQFDLREICAPSKEIDHNFCRSVAPSAPVVHMDGDLGVAMEISTTAPGVQIYSGKDIGIAIEPQHWPDAMHHANFPSIELRPGQDYKQSSTYRFSKV